LSPLHHGTTAECGARPVLARPCWRRFSRPRPSSTRRSTQCSASRRSRAGAGRGCQPDSTRHRARPAAAGRKPRGPRQARRERPLGGHHRHLVAVPPELIQLMATRLPSPSPTPTACPRRRSSEEERRKAVQPTPLPRRLLQESECEWVWVARPAVHAHRTSRVRQRLRLTAGFDARLPTAADVRDARTVAPCVSGWG